MLPSLLPKRVIDSHHHFLDTRSDDNANGNGKTFQSFLASLLPDEYYLPDQYQADVVEPLKNLGVTMVASVHVECMPNDGPQEVAWIDGLSTTNNNSNDCTVSAIVGSCNLASPAVNDDLIKLMAASSSTKLRGVRWILDCVGKYDEADTVSGTHVGTSRHDGIDYLRGSEGPDTYNGQAVPAFERGFALLADHNLSFDLQCAPVQLIQAAELCRRHPKVPVCIDHLGKARTLLGPDTNANISNTKPNAKELETWRKGMTAMAAVPHVYVKLSMLGYAVPGWIKTPERRALVKTLVQEVLTLFTPRRCMVAWNWWKDAEASDSDFLSDIGPTPVEYLEFMAECLEPYSEEDRDCVFYGTAKEFYRIDVS